MLNPVCAPIELEAGHHDSAGLAWNLRRDALSGLSASQQNQFVDALLAIKVNLSKADDGINGNGSKRRRR